ncbi:DUF4405 domain-containing protein [candidate division KSB1 bacterium]
MKKDNATPKRKFKTKSFASFSTALIFFILTITGIIIYFTPAGRIANWTNWTVLGLTKDEWQGFHVIFAAVFVGFIILHLLFNWKVLMSYMVNKKRPGFRLKREFGLALFVVGIIMTVTLAKWPPVWVLMDWKEDFKQQEYFAETEPPIPHIEDMTINDISLLIGLDVQDLLSSIQNKGYKIDNENITLLELAENNNTSPSLLYSEIVDNEHVAALPQYSGGGGSGLGRKSIEQRSEILNEKFSSTVRGGGRGNRSGNISPGYGKKTIGELCRGAGITIEQGLKNLMDNGINAEAGDRVSNLATSHNVRPSDIARYLAIK